MARKVDMAVVVARLRQSAFELEAEAQKVRIGLDKGSIGDKLEAIAARLSKMSSQLEPSHA